MEHDDPKLPIALALLVADAMFRDLGSGKLTIQGIYHAIGAPGFPFTHRGMMIYCALTPDGPEGKVSVTVRLIDADEQRVPIFQSPMELNFPDPFAVAEVVLPQGPMVFPEPGEYRLQLLCRSCSLLERRIHVIPIHPEPPESLDSPDVPGGE